MRFALPLRVLTALSAIAVATALKRVLRQVAKPVILYGIESCNVEAYNMMVDAQLNTWGESIPRENFIIVGGAHDDFNESHSSVKMPCGDGQEDLTCKEATLIARAVDRARKLDAQWLVLGQDDKYVWPEAIEQALASTDASKPQIFSAFGCGQAWKFHEESNEGTEPIPDGWVDPSYSCDAVWKHAGICGGPTYFMSRGALELMLQDGQTKQEFIDEFIVGSVAPGGQSDMAASCMMYSRGVEMKKGLPGRDVAVDMSTVESKGVDQYIEEDVKGTAGDVPLAAHIVLGKDDIPPFIEKIHAAYAVALRREYGKEQFISNIRFAQRMAGLFYAMQRKTKEGLFKK